MPAQQRLRPHEEDLPVAARQQPTQRRKQQPIVRLEPRSTSLPTKNRQLMPKHEDLQLLRPVTPSEEHEQLQQPTNDHVQREHKQRRPPVRRGRGRYRRLSRARVSPDRVSAPHALLMSR